MSERKAAKRKTTEELSEAYQETVGDRSQAEGNRRHEDEFGESSFPTQCVDDGPGQSSNPHASQGSSPAPGAPGPQQSSDAHAHSSSTSPTAQAKHDKMKIWERVLKVTKVEKYLLQCIDAQDMLVYFYYMPQAWSDRIRATHQRLGRYDGAKELLDYLPRLAGEENDWAEDFRMALKECSHDLLVELLDETYNALKDMPEDVIHCRPDKSMKVGSKDEDFSQDIAPAAKAVLQHRELWVKIFRENRKTILNFIEPRDILSYLQYLPRERILAICDNEGRTRGADELIESLFTCTEKTWMRDFTNALRSRQVNHTLLADLLDSQFRELLDKTENDPNYKELHDVYKKAKPCGEGQSSTLYYTGARKMEPTDSAGK